MDLDDGILDRLAASMRIAARHGRERFHAGPFEALLYGASADPLMSVALPVARQADWAQGLSELKTVFQAHQRRVRLEYFEELQPDLAAALSSAGLERRLRARVMVLTPDRFRPVLRKSRGRYERLSGTKPACLDAFLCVQCAAFGMPRETAQAWRPTLQAGLESGAIWAGAAWDDGRLVSGATIQVGKDAGELAGVSTRPSDQRRGWAGEVCTRLLGAWFESGRELCWLSAAEDAQGLYRKLGFVSVGTQLNYEEPASA